MRISDKIFEMARALMLANEKINLLTEKSNRMQKEVRILSDRVIRLETLMEVYTGQKPQPLLPSE